MKGSVFFFEDSTIGIKFEHLDSHGSLLNGHVQTIEHHVSIFFDSVLLESVANGYGDLGVVRAESSQL